jgi:1,4-dihydroxy-2-naphthoate octaprenyltransferase
MEFVQQYLQSERLLGLSAGIIGLLSITTGIIFYVNKPQFKVFAITMLIIGLIEAGLFITGYFLVNNQNNVNKKIDQFESNKDNYLKTDKIVVDKNLKAFFILKLIYAITFITLAIVLSKINIKPIYFGIFTALMIHLAAAIVIDTFGERYTKIYKTNIETTLKL